MNSFPHHSLRPRLRPRGPVASALPREADASQTLRGRARLLRPAPGGKKRFPCPYADCNSLLTRKNNLTRHLRIHSGGKPYVCGYDGCTQRFSLQGAMSAHRRLHPGYQPYPCPWPDCTRHFAGASRLKTHIRFHTGERPFPCPREACQQRFRSRGSLANHLASHRETRPFHCPWEPCASSFKRKDNLKLHLRIHLGEKPFACRYPDCDKTFMQGAHLAAHEKAHNRSATRNRRYTSGDDSRSRRARPASLRPCHQDRPFVCQHPGCERAFVLACTLKRHQRSVHDNRRPYACPVEGCGKAFKRRDALAPHLWIHKAPEFADQPATASAKPRLVRHNRPAQSQGDNAVATAAGRQEGQMSAPLPGTDAPPDTGDTGDTGGVSWGTISPRLPSSPLSAECLQWLARQTPGAGDGLAPDLQPALGDNDSSSPWW